MIVYRRLLIVCSETNNYSIAIILNRPQFPNGKYQWTCHFPVFFFLLSWETGTGDFHALFRSRRSIGVCIRSSSGNQSNDNNAVGRGIEKEIKDNLQQLLIRNTSKFVWWPKRFNIYPFSLTFLAYLAKAQDSSYQIYIVLTFDSLFIVYML
jgi:hypothetical protein